MLFDEAARAFLGVPAAQYKRSLLPQYPQLPFVLAEIVEGLHVAFHCQRQVSANPNFPVGWSRATLVREPDNSLTHCVSWSRKTSRSCA